MTRYYPANRCPRDASLGERVKHYAKPLDSGCWLWTASLRPDGYGILRAQGRLYRAHRASYEAFVGPIPDGLQLDHLCRNRWCVNPQHLEPVTSLENSRRSPLSLIVINAAKTQCAQGHDYDAENTGHTKEGWRYCRTCARLRTRDRRAAKVSAASQQRAA